MISLLSLLMASLQFVGNEGIYIVWVKDKKVTLKNPPSREFHRYLARRPYLQDTREILQAGMTLRFQHVLLTWLFCG